ncbi:Ig-like domain-containing protein [Deinococcus sonorensis]|uniref:Ig-like domain-containing protein n=2 Tax=Deinococcus sonorensis TaxID=309891 RepID=A0AAU7UAS7_9DEIO
MQNPFLLSHSRLAASALLLTALLAACNPPVVDPPPPPPPPPPTNLQIINAECQPATTQALQTLADTAPSVRTVTPANNATNVSTLSGVTAEVSLLSNSNGGNGIDPRTISSATIYLTDSSGAVVPSNANTSGGGDTIVLTPTGTQQLKAFTTYTFHVTSGLKDLNGVGFTPFQSSFTTGATQTLPPASFTKVALGTVPQDNYTNLTIGPDHKLYAATLKGVIRRFTVNADGTLGAAEDLRSLVGRDADAGNPSGYRSIIGLTFDPASTASNPILYVSNNYYYDFQKKMPDWTGKITRLCGPGMTKVKDLVVGLPRSTKDHMTNSVSFSPKDPNSLYILQGASNSGGAPDPIWDYRTEHLLTAAMLRLDFNKVDPKALPLNVKTEDDSGNPAGYNPYASGAPLQLYATGIRNGYTMVWHSNGQLYVPTNGSASGGITPERPATLPALCANRLVKASSLPYAPQITMKTPEADFLFRVDQNGYYGHPNPTRCEYTMNAGHTSGTDAVSVAASGQVPEYPLNTLPDPNYRTPAYIFPTHSSADGAVEYTRAGSSLNGKLLVVRYSTFKDIVALDVSGTGGSVKGSMQPGVIAFNGTNEASPLAVTEDVRTGNLYVAQLNETTGSGTISLARPQ